MLPLLAALLPACASDDDGRSIDAFCDTYWSGAIELHNEYESANVAEDRLSQFLNVVTAPNDIAVLLDEVAEVAPKDILADVRAVRDAFQQVSSSTGDALTNPFEALVGNLGTGLAVVGSVQRLDDYVSANCEVPAEVRSATSAGSAASQAAECPDLAAVTAVDTEITPRTPWSTLARRLAPLAREGSPVAEPLEDLMDAVGALEPAPHFVHEAFARLRFDDLDPAELIGDVDTAAETSCGAVLFGEGAIDAIDRLMPRPASGGVTVHVDQVYGVDCFEPLPLAGYRAAFRCADDLAVVDLETGAVSWIEDVPDEAAIGPTYAAWVEVEEQPAVGLEPETWSSHLQILEFGGKKTRVPLAADVVADQGSTPGDVLAVRPDRILVGAFTGDLVEGWLVARDGAVIQHYVPDGERIDFSSFSETAERITENSVYVTGLVIELSSGELTPVPTISRVGRTVCPGVAQLTEGLANRVSRVVEDPTTGEVQVQEVPIQGDAESGFARPDLYVSAGYNGAAGFDLAGRELWRLADDIVDSSELAGGWVIVTNRSGQEVVVDPYTGREADGGAAILRELARVGEDRYDPSSRSFLTTGGVWRQVPIGKICG